MAVVLGVAALVLFVVAVAIGPAPESPILWVFVVLGQALWPLLLLLSVVSAFRDRISAWARQVLLDVAGPAVVQSMAPRVVLDSVLNRVFGHEVGHDEILAAVLGGAGRRSDGVDTAVSSSTTVQIRLERIDEKTCGSQLTWSHVFSGVRNNHLYMIFGTFNREIFTSITNERTYPLYEVWFLKDDDELEEFVPNLRSQLEFGVSYLDENGGFHVVPPRPEPGEVVALRSYGDFVKLPESVDRDELRIVKVDLYDLTDPDHVVTAIEGLTVRASSVGPFELGFTTWQVPHPCYVTTVTFDVSELARDGERLVYQVVSSTLKKAEMKYRGSWIETTDRIEVSVESWMLTGHGVTLLWRPVNGAENER